MGNSWMLRHSIYFKNYDLVIKNSASFFISFCLVKLKPLLPNIVKKSSKDCDMHTFDFVSDVLSVRI